MFIKNIKGLKLKIRRNGIINCFNVLTRWIKEMDWELPVVRENFCPSLHDAADKTGQKNGN